MREITQKVQYVDITKLKLHPENPRLIKDKQFEILKDSIKDNPEYFEARPILCNKAMVVFAGNMRLRAALDLDLKEVPVVIMDLTPEKERELLIRDNVSNGEWQMDVLANSFEVDELRDFGLGDDVLGILSSAEKVPESEAKAVECERCRELRDQVRGHEDRSGHKIDFSEPEEE